MDEPVASNLSWVGIVRLGLVQTAIGAIFVLATSTLNRVMVIELALPAVLPGMLIGLHYATQVLRPALGYGSDRGGRRTPWLIGGMAVLASGCVLAAAATGLMSHRLWLGIALAVPAFLMIGVGVGAAGTNLFVLLATRTNPGRRPAAATLAHLMMIVGFIVTAGIAGKTLDPFSPSRLVIVAAFIAAACFLVATGAVLGLEGGNSNGKAHAGQRHEATAFGEVMRQVWAEPSARRFALFIFVSMLAYGGEELMVEPFGGSVFGLTPGQTAKLSGAMHGGSLAGMILVGMIVSLLRRRRAPTLEGWMVAGCVASAAALAALAGLGFTGFVTFLVPTVFMLGLANGGYAIAAIAGMMQRVDGNGGSAGVRMGLWGAAQALAFGGGGLAATLLSDTARHLLTSRPAVYAIVFLGQAAAFLAAAVLAARLDRPERSAKPVTGGVRIPAAG